MATTTWALANVDYDVSDGFCHTAHWTVTRTDLKTADIIADVKAVLGTTQVDAILSGLTLKISEEKTPTQGSFVPAS